MRHGRQQKSEWLLLAGMGALMLLIVEPACALEARSEISALIVEHWTTERGLPQSSVNDLLQTRDGYLWVATFGGLARFDGVGFRVFEEGETGLPSGRILSLLEDRTGRIWVGTEQRGVVVWDGERFADPLPSPLADPTVWAMAEDTEGTIWIATSRGAVSLRDGRARTWTAADGLPSTWVRDLAVDPQGTVWAATAGGVASLAGQRFEVRSTEPAWAIAVAEGRVLAAGEHALVELPSGLTRIALRDGGAVPLGRALIVDRAGSVWLGGEALVRWRSGATALDLAAADRLQMPIRSLLEDREGNLWVGTNGAGLVQLRSGAVTTLGSEEGLVGDSALPIVEDASGRMWIGTFCGGLTRVEGRVLREVPVPAAAGAGPPCVRSLELGRDGTLWVGKDGLARLDRSGWSQVATNATIGAVHGVLEDRRGELWTVGTSGVYRLRPGGSLERVAALGDGPLWGLAELEDGRLAFGATGLVLLYDRVAPPERIALGGSRPDVQVRDFWEAPDGALWAATYGAGLVRIAPDRRIGWLGVEQGLPDRFLSRVLADPSGQLWFSGNRGIYRVAAEELERAVSGGPPIAPRVLGVADGMRVAEANGGGRPAGWLARDGRIWFPTVRGVAVVDPRRLDAGTPPPPAHVEALMVDGRTLPARQGLELAGGAGRIEIRYTGIGLARPDRVRFRHRLIGYDDWQDAGTRRFAVYTRLPAGRYRFEVIAASEGGDWSPQPAALAFSVAPRWFETTAVRVAAAILAIAALWGLHRLWLVRLRRRQRELEREVAARTAELSELNANLTRIVSEQTGQIRETRDMAILTLAKLAELRDGTTGEHLDRIARYARRLAQALADGPFGPLGAEFIEELFRSSPLHDIGKVAIPDQILNKPGPLTAREWAIMRNHTTIGGDTLGRVVAKSASHSFLEMGREIAYSHHERWDGDGYPRGRAGDETPLPARLVALVDAYDAITSARPYKPAHSHVEAVARIERDRGRHFDPRLVEAFLLIHEDFDRIRRDHPAIAGSWQGSLAGDGAAARSKTVS